MVVATVLIAACNPATGAEEQVQARYEMVGPVNDYADILSPETEAKLSRDIRLAWTRYGPQLVVVTVPSLDGEAIEDFSLKLANSWGVGHKNRDDGLMLLVAPNERKVRIEVGTGIEDSFPDDFALGIIENDILPAFRDDDFDRGVMAGTTALIARMRAAPTIGTNDNGAPDIKETG